MDQKQSERKMAWIAKINAIEPIENADAIEVAVIGGWKCVVKKGEFKANELCIYISIDSWVPTKIAQYLSKGKEPSEYNGVKGERLRTIKLRGQVSQGLLLPLSVGFGNCIASENIAIQQQAHLFNAAIEGTDVTEVLGIQKWEAPLTAQLGGVCRGTFPTRISKTDQERIQNLSKDLAEWLDHDDRHWEVTEKLEGSSCTIAFFDDEIHVCSRNMDLKDTNENTFWTVAKQNNLIHKFESFCRKHNIEIALQGELIGPGVQGNIYNLKKHEFRLFDVFDIKEFKYLTQIQRLDIARSLDINHVPIIAYNSRLIDTLNISSMEDMLKFAEGKSKLANVEREGVVFKCTDDPEISFKVISNKYLLKEN